MSMRRPNHSRDPRPPISLTASCCEHNREYAQGLLILGRLAAQWQRTDLTALANTNCPFCGA